MDTVLRNTCSTVESIHPLYVTYLNRGLLGCHVSLVKRASRFPQESSWKNSLLFPLRGKFFDRFKIISSGTRRRHGWLLALIFDTLLGIRRTMFFLLVEKRN